MKRSFLNPILAGIFFLSACEQKQMFSNSSNQNMNQVNANKPVVSSQKIPTNTRQNNSNQSTYKPKNGYVPDEQTAISIAVAVWIPIYGKEHIESEKPYKATLKEGIWTVTGTLPEGFDGGTAEAEISQESGCVLRIIHYQ